MKYLLWAALVGAFSVNAQPTPSAAYQASGATNTLFTDIAHTKNSVIAVGQYGTIVTSQDGVQWQQANSPVDVLLNAVFFVDEQTGWACGHDASIIKTQDGGRNWSIQMYAPDVDKPCLDIHFFDAQNGIAIGAYGMYFHTSDGGQHWQKSFLSSLLYEEDQAYLAELKETDPEGYEIETSAILPHFNRIALTRSGLYLVGEMGLIAHSTDKGKTWQREQEIYHGSFFDVTQVGEHIIVAGLRGNAFSYSEQTGWQQLQNQEQATINSIVKDADNGAYLFANSGVIYRLAQSNATVLNSTQQSDGKAILDGTQFKGKLILATEDGIKTKEIN